ncbi:peroxiredoxin-like family protein [Edaphobacter bradus]|uniref:peroxiredoxin-like family protein n=1 Tax=Edaphobacter bradus TaxID=2259016 RepID=UPI0021DF63EC|nr:peroxiredoxin-like family protein [Edaphobacter bradus]
MATQTQVLQTTSELDEARDHYRNRVIPADKLAIMDRATEALVHSGQASRALKPGDRVSDFILMDAHGSPVRLQQLLEHGPVVVAFYRGGWCPYCNIELRGLQRVLREIQQLGASLVAISPQLPDNSLTTAEKNALEFPVLSDVGNTVARRFGIVFTLPADLLETYEGFQHGLLEKNGKVGASQLPIPATFVLDQHGVIQLAYVDADYTRRLDPEIVLDKLRELSQRS